GERSYGAAVIGVEPTDEAKISSIAHTIENGRYLEAGEQDGAILGDLLARNLKLSVGDRVTLLGEARDGSVAADVLHIKGIYHSGIPELDRSILEMAFRRAQETFAMENRASTIAVGGGSLSDVNSALSGLNTLAHDQNLAVLDWSALEPALADGIALKY